MRTRTGSAAPLSRPSLTRGPPSPARGEMRLLEACVIAPGSGLPTSRGVCKQLEGDAGRRGTLKCREAGAPASRGLGLCGPSAVCASRLHGCPSLTGETPTGSFPRGSTLPLPYGRGADPSPRPALDARWDGGRTASAGAGALTSRARPSRRTRRAVGSGPGMTACTRGEAARHPVSKGRPGPRSPERDRRTASPSPHRPGDHGGSLNEGECPNQSTNREHCGNIIL